MDTYFPIMIVIWIETEILLIKKGNFLTKVNVSNKTVSNEVSSKLNVDIIGIIVYMCLKHNF